MPALTATSGLMVQLVQLYGDELLSSGSAILNQGPGECNQDARGELTDYAKLQSQI